MDFTWLFDTVGLKWHLWNSGSISLGDTAFCGRAASDDDAPSGDNSNVPVKCTWCFASGSNAGLPI
jgi:hypothetical protein